MNIWEFMSDSPFLTAFIVYCVCQAAGQVLMRFAGSNDDINL